MNRRSAGSAALAALAAAASAQVNLSGPISQFSLIMQKQGMSNAATKPQNPLQPSGFPPLPSKTNELPPPQAYGSDETYMRILQAGSSSQEDTKVHLDDGFHVRYKGYDIFGDRLDGDRTTDIYTSSGHVRLLGVDQEITGDVVTVDFNNKTYKAERLHADLKPSFFPQGTVVDDVYVNGEAAHGSGKEVFSDYGFLTTCNLPDPHFQLYFKHADLRPGKRLILRGVTLYILDKKIITIPYLSIPLDSRQNHIYPEVGDDPTAGYYVKTYIPIPLHGVEDTLTARLDAFSKLGIGLGAIYDYRNKTMSGEIQAYGIEGHSSEQDLDIQHDEHFGKTDWNIAATYSNNDFLTSPGSTLLNLRTQLTVPWKNGSTDQFSFSDSTNSYQGFTSLSQSFTFTDTRNWNARLRTNLSVSYSDSGTSGGTPGFDQSNYSSKMLDITFDGNDDFKKATAELQYAQNVPIGAGTTALYGLQNMTPELTVKSDATRLLSQKLAQEFPFTTDLSVGQLGAPNFEGTGESDLWRFLYDFGFIRPDHPNLKFDYTWDTRFQQGVYSDSTAEYTTGFDFGTRYNLGPDTAWDTHYSYNEQHGYTPILQDKQGQTNLATTDISYRPIHSVILAAQTGYDMMAYQEGIPSWQDVGLRAEWHPVNYFQFRTLATYDTTYKGISTVQCDIAYKPGATFISAGFRYDGEQHTIGEWDLFIDGLKWGRFKASIDLDFDGYAHTFTAEQLYLTYDLHCAEAVFQVMNDPTGFRAGTQLAFFIRLKAFPYNTPFGTGTQGQAVGAGFGRTTF